MPTLNKVSLEGRVSFTKDWDKVQSFNLSQSRSKKNKETNEWENAGYVNLNVKNFNVNEFRVKDGDIIELEGFFDVNNEYTTKEGSKVSYPVIIATSISLKNLNKNDEQKVEESEEIDLDNIPF